MSKGVKIGIISIVVLLAVSFILVNVVLSGDIIHSNITINGTDVGGLTTSQAESVLKGKTESIIDNSVIVLKYKERSWGLSYRDAGFSYSYKDAVAKAYSIGHSGGLFKKLTEVVRAQINREDIPLDYSYEEGNIKNILEQISKEIGQEAKDATIVLEGGSFTYTDETEGRRLSADQTLDLIKARLDAASAGDLELIVETVQPDIKRVDLENIKEKLGEYSTKFNAGDTDRTHNIKIATSSISHMLIKPGEVFSLNKNVGPRLAKHGYKLANVIVNNELVPGIGGGVCQVSSTLYNAALLSNMKIVERKSHALPSAYIALGRDATLSEDFIDLKFENTTGYPVYLYGEVSGSWVKFIIYGRNDNPGRTVRIKTEVIKQTSPTVNIIEDPTLPEGTEVEEKKAYTGYVVKSYRIIVENGKDISTEELPLSVYRVVNGVKRVGTMKIAPPVIPENPEETTE